MTTLQFVVRGVKENALELLGSWHVLAVLLVASFVVAVGSTEPYYGIMNVWFFSGMFIATAFGSFSLFLLLLAFILSG